MEKIIMKWTEGRSKGSPIPTMVIRTILAMFSRSFSIVVHEVCLLFSAIFNPNLWKTHVHLHGRSAAALRKITSYRTTICRCLRRTTTEFLKKVEFSMSCTVHRWEKLTWRKGKWRKEHRDACQREMLEKSVVAEHAWKDHNSIRWEEATVVDKAKCPEELPLKKALHIYISPCWGMPQLGHRAWDPRIMDGCPEEAGN